MLKGYVTWWKARERREEQRMIDVGFDPRPENAACWDTREQAEGECQLLNSFNIAIPSAEGGSHLQRL
jgi:hypothetical protein